MKNLKVPTTSIENLQDQVAPVSLFATGATCRDAIENLENLQPHPPTDQGTVKFEWDINVQCVGNGEQEVSKFYLAYWTRICPKTD